MAPHVFIIGNGFDLNLGLKTSYQDFIKSEHFKNHLGKGKQLFEHLQSKYELQKWVDIEHELGIFSNTRSECREFVLAEYKELCASLLAYMASLKLDNIDEQSAAFALIKDNFKDNIEFFNFNYTNSIQYILKNRNMPSEKINKMVYHIHGSLSQKNIVFGVDDSTEIYPKHSFLRKSFSYNYGEKNINDILSNANKLTFFGHSLGSTDHMYFQKFFTKYAENDSHGKKLNFYYYGETGKNELHEQLHTLTNGKVGALKHNTEFNSIDICK